MRRMLCTLLLLAASAAAVGCTTYTEDLNRGQHHFETNEYERALAIWRVLEADMNSLTAIDKTRYAYLRGMTDFRLSMRDDARHWLGIARALEKQTPGGLQESWKQRLDEAMTDLDKDVLGGADSAGDTAEAPAAPEPPPPPAKNNSKR